MVRFSIFPVGRWAALFPLIGAIFGAAGAGILLAAGAVLPPSIAALAVVLFWAAISPVLHEGRIGALGGTLILLSILARWQALEHLATDRLLALLIASQAVPRAATVALAWISRPSGNGLGFEFSSTLTSGAAILAILQGIAAAMFCGPRAGLAIVFGSYLVIRLVQALFYKRIGGVDADSFGVTEQILEIGILILFTCRDCTW